MKKAVSARGNRGKVGATGARRGNRGKVGATGARYLSPPQVLEKSAR